VLPRRSRSTSRSRLRFRLRLRGRLLEVDLERRGSTYTLLEGEPLDLSDEGRELRVAVGNPVSAPREPPSSV